MNILDIPMYDGPLQMAVDMVIRVCLMEPKVTRCISATSAHGLIVARKDPAFAEILQKFYLNLPDGMPGVWVGRLKGASHMERCYGPDFFAAVIEASAGKGINHFLCGGKEGVADALKVICRQKYHNDQITGIFCPPFRELTTAEFQQLGQKITQSGAHIVWIGLSTPKQEWFAGKLVQFVTVPFIITVGAAFDFHTGEVKQATRWIRQMGLEWLFRLCMEPKRLFRRYMQVVPLFIYYNLDEYRRYLVSKTVRRES